MSIFKPTQVDEIFPKNVILQMENFQGKSAEEIETKLIRPNLEEINKLTGQENNARYLAYMVQFILMEATK